MKFVITAGGTGGHIYPALSVIDKIKEDKSNQYMFIGTKNRMESELIPSLNIDYKGIEIYGLTKNLKKNYRNIKLLFKAIDECSAILKEYKPDAVIAFGGYVTCPVIIAAKRLGIKVYIHEQNVIPGKVNKYLAHKADKIFVSFEESLCYFKKNKALYTGNPVAERAIAAPKIDKTTLGFERHCTLVVIVMGSLGSEAVNKEISQYLETFTDFDKEVLFVTGKSSYEQFKNTRVINNVKIVPYFDNLPGILKDCDLIISRAGASTISEILALDLPSVLIPSPYVSNNHQYYNALELQEKGLAYLLPQKKITTVSLNKCIRQLVDHQIKRDDMIEKLKAVPKLKSSTLIYDYIKKNK